MLHLNLKKEDNQLNFETSLFRKEVLEHKKVSYLGKVIIIMPISFFFWSLGIFAIAVVLGLFLYFAQYTKKHEVVGILVPDSGLIHVYAKKPGVVVKKFVDQNDNVKKGQILYLISTEQNNLSRNGIFTQQIKSLDHQIKIQKNRLVILKKKLRIYENLLKENLTTEIEYQKYYDNYLITKIGLEDLKKSLSQVKGESDYVIQASQDGNISVLIPKIGDRVTMDKLVASIIPVNSKLQGELFIPSQTIGFIEREQKVLLKYRAYPYQNFGLYESSIASIDQSILSPQDLDLPILLNEPFYRARVNLKHQSITAYGKVYPLVAGMLVDATILVEKRSLWEWIINPLYSFKESLVL